MYVLKIHVAVNLRTKIIVKQLTGNSPFMLTAFQRNSSNKHFTIMTSDCKLETLAYARYRKHSFGSINSIEFYLGVLVNLGMYSSKT